MALKLLIVDDDTEVLKAIQSILKSLGYETVALSDSREAQVRVDREKMDGIFLDARMPYLDGFRLAQHIRQSASNGGVPIVMITAYADVETMRKGLDAGVTFFLTKPVEVRKLEQLLRLLHGAMLKERRRYARLPFRTIVTCQFEQHEFKSESVNIGEGGMLLDGTGGMATGQEVNLRFSLPKESEPIDAHAKVVRRESPDRMAVQFLTLEAESKRGIQGYIARFVLG